MIPIKSFITMKTITPVMIKKDYILGTTFHPELTDDVRIHKYFINMIKDYKTAC